VAGAPTPGRLIAVLGERGGTALVVHALRSEAADVVAVRALGVLEVVTRTAQLVGQGAGEHPGLHGGTDGVKVGRPVVRDLPVQVVFFDERERVNQPGPLVGGPV